MKITTSPQSGSVHLLLRIPKYGHPIERVAELHNAVATRHRTVWLGIVGKTYSAQNLEDIRQRGQYLYVVQHQRNGLALMKARIKGVDSALPETDRHLAPEYYVSAQIIERAKVWVRITTLRVTPIEELDTLRVKSSGKKATCTLNGLAYVAIVENEH
jgi:hypothetical protein